MTADLILYVYLAGFVPAWCLIARWMVRYWVSRCPTNIHTESDVMGDVGTAFIWALLWPLLVIAGPAYLFARCGLTDA